MPPATPRRAAGCADLCSIFRAESSQAANASKFTIFFRAPPLGVFALSKKGERELKSEKTFTTNFSAWSRDRSNYEAARRTPRRLRLRHGTARRGPRQGTRAFRASPRGGARRRGAPMAPCDDDAPAEGLEPRKPPQYRVFSICSRSTTRILDLQAQDLQSYRGHCR